MTNTFNTFYSLLVFLFFLRGISVSFCKIKNTTHIYFFPHVTSTFSCYQIFSGNMGPVTAARYSIMGTSHNSLSHLSTVGKELLQIWEVHERSHFVWVSYFPDEKAASPEASNLSKYGQLVRGSLGLGTPRPWSLLLLASHAASWASARHFLEPNCRALPTFFLNYIL